MIRPLRAYRARIRREAIAECVTYLHAEADSHRGRTCSRVRRQTLRRAALHLDGLIDHHVQRETSKAANR